MQSIERQQYKIKCSNIGTGFYSEDKSSTCEKSLFYIRIHVRDGFDEKVRR